MAGSAVAKAKSLYASGARGAGKVLTKVGVLGEDPPPRDKRWKHWAFSLTRAHDSLAIAELDVPWWTYDAIDTVEKWIADHPEPVRVFEWGSGASTLWLARRVDTAPQVALSGDARQANLASAIAVTLPAAVEGGEWVVVDDVSTTGATLSACRDALLAAGARRVVGVVLARTPSSALRIPRSGLTPEAG